MTRHAGAPVSVKAWAELEAFVERTSIAVTRIEAENERAHATTDEQIKAIAAMVGDTRDLLAKFNTRLDEIVRYLEGKGAA